jgi:mono/diheme cytochrome c family protein
MHQLRRIGFGSLAAAWLAVIMGSHLHAAPAQQSAPPAASAATPQAVFQRYCLTCHTEAMKSRGTVPAAFEALLNANVAAHADEWEDIVRKVRAGLMPPAGAARPDRATQERLLGWVEGELDRAAAANPNPGRTQPFHRLNRTEYRNAIRDLLDLDVNVAGLLPADDASYGFDNIAGVLKMSPTLLERYLAAAQKISRQAVGTPPPAPNVDYFRLADDLQQDVHLDGLPIGTRGGIAIKYTFPMDAEYEIRPRLARDVNESVPSYLEAQHLEITVDGERVQVFTLPGVSTPQTPPAGRGAVSSDTSDDDQQPAAAPARAGGAGPVAGGRGAQAGARGGNARPRPQISQIDAGLRVSGEERQRRNRADESWNARVRVTAGEHELTLAFLAKTSALDETTRLPFLRPYPAAVNTPETRMGVHLRSVEIVGPYSPTGSGSSASRRRIFVCTPAAAAEELPCAKKIFSTLARRAYRRPVTDPDLQPLVDTFTEARKQGSFDVGIERAVRRLLVSPEFLFRVERDPANVRPNTPYRVSDLELASRLSFFLWSSIPDEELLSLAEKGRLRDSGVLAAQVKRMIADPRFDTFVTNFAGQWLYLRNLPSTGPVDEVYPDFDDVLRQAFQRETELFFESVVREDRSALDLLRADYTFLNERLARHYGIPGIKGSHFRRVTLPADSVRGGLLGHGSILTVTSQPDRTSPVVRGKWILENFLGTSPPDPPPNVPDLKPSVEPGAVLSMRERMAAHRGNPTCAACHAIMDPIGLSLENFDGVGRFRTLSESSQPIDASGALPDGTKFVGAAGLRQVLLTRSDQFAMTVAEKLLTYALGRGVEYYDRPAVRAIVKEAAMRDYRFSSGLILGVVESAPFQMRRTGDTPSLNARNR